MKNYQVRNYLQISNIIMNQNVPTDDFIGFFQLTPYEYKADMKRLKEMQKYFGIEILQDQREITCSVVDQEVYRSKSELCKGFYFRHYNKPLITNNLINNCVVSLMFLSAKREITIAGISEELNYSKSSIRKPIKWARNFLSTYKVNTINKPHHGISVIGNEFNKRLCIIAVNSFIDPRLIVDLEPALIYNQTDDCFEQKVSSVIDEINRQHIMRLTTSNLTIIYQYLVIQKKRLLAHYETDSFAAFDTGKIKDTYEYSLAQKILIGLYGENDLHENEIISLSILFLIQKEYFGIEYMGFFNFPSIFADIVDDLLDKLLAFLKCQYQFSLEEPIYRDALRNSITKLIIKDYFGVLNTKAFNLAGRTFALSRNPLLSRMGTDISVIFSGHFGYRVPLSHLSEIIDIMQRFIQSRNIESERKIIGIITGVNLVDSFLLKEIIEKSISDKLYRSVEILNYHPAGQLPDTGQYIFILDHLLNPDIGIHAYFLDKYNNDLGALTNFLRYNRDLCSPNIQEIACRRIMAGSEEEVITCMLSALGTAECTNPPFPIAVCNGILFLLCKTARHERAVLHLYKLDHVIKSSIENHPCSRAVALAYLPSENNIRLLDCILKLLANDIIAFEDLYDNPDSYTLNNYLNTLV